MPAHLIKRKDRGGLYYIVDGEYMASTKTRNEEYANALLDKYVRNRLGIAKIDGLKADAELMFKQFGMPGVITTMGQLRFPCVYAFITDGEIVYVGSSINGFGRLLASHHPMAVNASNDTSVVFWVVGSEGEARELEIKMIQAIKPKFNLTPGGQLKKTGYHQRRRELYPDIARAVQLAVRQELRRKPVKSRITPAVSPPSHDAL